jgi:predicted metalloprotease with PDZ domain
MARWDGARRGAFATVMYPKSDLKVGPDGTGVGWLLSHELFHTWNGDRYELDAPEAVSYWFSEGFTNFYARRLLLRAGLMSGVDYVANVNDEVRRYLLSAIRTENAAKAAPDFFKSTDAHDLVYRRGDVVAMLVDAEIRRASGGERTLDALMQAFLRAHPPSRRPVVSSDALLAKIASFTSRAFAEKIRGVVLRGEVPDIPSSLFAPCMKGHVEALGPFELALDEAAAHDGRIERLVAGSNAEKAGLKNGRDAVLRRGLRRARCGMLEGAVRGERVARVQAVQWASRRGPLSVIPRPGAVMLSLLSSTTMSPPLPWSGL